MGNQASQGDIDKLPPIFGPCEYKDHLASPSVSIYKVPATIRCIQEKAFEPQVVSFGPISRRKDKLCPMDHYKLDAVNRTLKRINAGDGKGNLGIDDLVEEVERKEKEIRNCYEDRAIEWNAHLLAWMLTMDACFILEFLRRCHENNGEFSLLFNNADNPLVNDILMDILKLENQIPLFILKHILELEGKNWAHFLGTLLEKCILFKGFPFSESLSCKEQIEGAYHLLDVCTRVIRGYLTNGNGSQTSACDTGCRCQCRSSCWSDGNCCSVIVPIALCAGCDTANRGHRKFSAEKLKNAGIEFKAGKGRVYFEKDTFYLNSITVDYKTEIVLRNLVAFEHCQKWRQNGTIISEYIMLMEDLIDSEADVHKLKKKDIVIRNTGSDKEIVKMFDTLCKGINASRENLFHTELAKVNERYENLPKIWKSQFMKKYCSNPWLVVSLLTATLILALTIFQAVLALLDFLDIKAFKLCRFFPFLGK